LEEYPIEKQRKDIKALFVTSETKKRTLEEGVELWQLWNTTNTTEQNRSE